MDDRELLIRTSVLLEAALKKIETLESKVDGVGVLKEKVDRMEKTVFGALAAVFVEIIARIAIWIQQKN